MLDTKDSWGKMKIKMMICSVFIPRSDLSCLLFVPRSHKTGTIIETEENLKHFTNTVFFLSFVTKIYLILREFQVHTIPFVR